MCVWERGGYYHSPAASHTRSSSSAHVKLVEMQEIREGGEGDWCLCHVKWCHVKGTCLLLEARPVDLGWRAPPPSVGQRKMMAFGDKHRTEELNPSLILPAEVHPCAVGKTKMRHQRVHV